MFIDKGFPNKNRRSFYFIGAVVAFGVCQMGQLALLIHWKLLVANGIAPQYVDPNTIMATLSEYINKNLILFYLTSSFALALGVLYCFLKFVHKRSFLSVITSRKTLDWRRLGFAFVVQAVLVIAGFVYSYLTSSQDFVWQFQWGPFFGLLFVACLFLPLQSAFEEVLFRGYLLQAFAIHKYSRLIPIVVTSCIFGALHMSNPEVLKHGSILALYYVGFGVFSAVWATMDNGIELCVGAHVANNLFTALLVCSPESALQTFSLFKTNVPFNACESIVSFYVSALLLTFLFAKRYKWKHWKKLVAPSSL